MKMWIFGLSEMQQDQTMVYGRDTFVCVCMCFILYLHPCVCALMIAFVYVTDTTNAILGKTNK